MRHFVLSAALLFTCTSSLHAYERLQGPTDVVYWDKTKAQTGYTFFGTRGVTYLIDMQGCIVQTWPLGANPRLLDNGNVLDATSLTPDEFRSLAEVSWSGSNVWQYTETRAAYAPHHDFLRIYNKKLGTNTTLYIAAKTVTSNQCIAAGCNPASAPYTNAQVDAIVEIDMAGAVVWEWCFFDHGIQDFDAGKSNYVGSGKTIANYPGRLNLNLPGRPLTKDWLHCTSLDYNTNLDQIVISAEGGEFYVIDHGKTFTAGNPAASIALAAGTNGDFVYRFGDPARHGQGNPPSINLNWTTSTTGNKQIGGVSQVQWIPQGVPGAGNFMVFNNGQDLFETSPQSYIFEVNPFINAGATNTSNYVSPPSAGYSNWAAPGHDTDKRTKQLSRQVIWKYFSMANQGFFSHIGGSVQRMANSNILVCSTAEGHVFEVAQASNVVWEYISPITTNGVVEYKRDTWPMANALARACRYATNHLALIGHTLVPGSTISGRTPAYISAPTISGTGYTPQPPTAVDSIWVTAVISNARAVASATLVYNAGSSNVSVTMLDDGSHNDGANGDSIYGGVIPAFITGTTVRFYITAQDDFSNSATDPASAPGTTFSYVVNLIPEPAGPVVLATGLAWLVRRRGMARGRFVAMLACAAIAMHAGRARAAWSMLKLPDTGQTQDFTSTFGEDSNYTINPPSLADNGDGTVSDSVTGLVWQNADGGEMTWSNALVYALTNRVGGQSDWRLPTSHELFSILNHGTVNPALNTSMFTLSAAQYWWSSQMQAADPTHVWAANAGGGIGPHWQTETISAGGTSRYHVRCVRGAPAPSAPAHRFHNNGDGTVADLNTGLTWQQTAAVSTNWTAALQYAENLTLGGLGDWRLPNIKELRSLSDETLANPSLDTNYFPGANAAHYWSSTTLVNLTNSAWSVDFLSGLADYKAKSTNHFVRCVRGGAATAGFTAQFARIPAGLFAMGDHYGFIDPLHPSDEIPVHNVYLDSFYMATTLLTCREYADYLNAALLLGLVEVRSNYVYGVGGTNIYCDTYASDASSRIQWTGSAFVIRDNRDLHPVTGVRWFGAIAYCNWASTRDGVMPCYDLATGACILTNNGYRLPTEAEWEYAGRGGLYSPYAIFPWGNDTNASGALANWPASGDPFESGSYPWTTPVDFYSGALQVKTNFNWPGSQTTYQTRCNTNCFGLYDMSGNVWEWVNDWYTSDYYTNCVINHIVTNPPGPAAGGPMPDGKPYRGLRGGNWFNGEEYYGHGRVANRDPGYFRGPGDPTGPWFHVGFRPVRAALGVVAAGATLTQLVSGLHFTEGPTADATGNVFFSDIPGDTIYKWSLANQLSVFRTNSGGANGLEFDRAGNLLACEGDNGRLVSISTQLVVTALASTYGGVRFNEPNDLWIDGAGGVYFTDPVFFGHPDVQGGEDVYYLMADRSTVLRVVSDMVRPNGLVGTPDGASLYIADWGAGIVYRYTINTDGTLAAKTFFAAVACDGMTLDSEGNVYLTEDDVLVYDAAGSLIERIAVPERPTNVTFGGSDRKSLFVTTEAGALYSIKMRVQGAASPGGPTNHAPVITGVTMSPAAPTAADPVWVTACITDDVSVVQATLLYRTGAGASQTNTAFLETMRTTAVKPWTGDGCDNPWTIAFVSANPFEQRSGSNYGGGNTNGMEFKQGTANLGDSMITATQTIDARGTAGFVEFWIWAAGLSGTAGWTFQLDAGSGYATRLSELTGTSHSWQVYHYDLQSAELVSNLSLRFQFAGGAAENRIDLDYISVKTLVADATWTSVPMYDDGVHQDGAAGDGVYGTQVPAQTAGTAVSYYLTATDSAGAATVEPTGAPTLTYSYTVSSVVTSVAKTVGMFLNTSNAFDGYTLMAPMHFTNTYLINNAGQVVHQWASSYEPGRSAYLLENGHMIRACMTKSGGPSTGGGEGGRIEEYDWNGTMVWAIDYYSANYIHHHDFKVLPSGNILLLVAEKKTYAEVVAAGFNTNLLDAQIVSSGYMLPDSLVEVTPTGTYGGIVVWEWHLWDHMIQDYDPTNNNYGVVANHPELIDVNGTGIKIPQFWNHVNAIDHNPQLDQVILSIRGNSELFVIDHQVTMAQAASHSGGRYNKGGDILYRWGNPQQYNRGTSANQILYQQHHTHWIETNRPGAGNILIFNNGIGRNYSTINEIAPPVDVTGVYARAAAAAFGPPTNVWLYTASPPTNFYSAEISGCQRQPNGNTLICEGIKGNLFEVNPAGQTVWRYLCPVTTEPLHQGDAIPVDPARTDQFMNAVFRVYRYAPDFPGLAGRDLTPYGVIEIYQDAPAVDLTNAAVTVDYGVATTAIGGLNNAYVAGMMTWTNRLTGACAAFSAATAWRADDIGLAIGDNIIVVAGTNAAGIPACDKVTITRLLPEPALMLGLVCALWALRRAA